MAAKSKPVDQVTTNDLGLDAAALSANQSITTVTAAPAREAGEKLEDDGTAFEKVVEFLDGLKVI
jgi:electron transfer flavoprotein beta subunit